MQSLTQRWQNLIQQFTGGNPGIENSLNQMYQQEGLEVVSRNAVDMQLFDWMGQAIAILQ